jgi:ferredoxin
MSRPLWVVDLLKKVYPKRILGAKATNIPVVGRLLDHWLFNGDGLIFLPQDRVARTVPINQSIDRADEMVLPSRVVEYFVEQASVHWIMDFCLCRAAEGCKDYPIELGCLFLGEAALGINPELGRRVTKQDALEHVQRCREAGLVHFVGRNKLDTIWLGIGPGHKLLTVCSCCPCCCLWGVLPHVTPRISGKIQRMPGVTVTVNDQCVGCGVCTEDVCFMDAIRLEEGQAVIDDTCKGCGRCVDICPQGAIDLSVENEHFVDDAIAHISTLVELD